MVTPLKTERLRRASTTDGWRQIDVAAAVGIDQSHYARIEKGEVSASPPVAAALAVHFGHAISEMQILYPERFAQPSESAA